MAPKLDDYEAISTIGSGAHGIVKKIRRKKDGQIFVWKELDYRSMTYDEKQGLVLEVNLLKELNHKNIVKCIHHIVDKKTATLYIVMEHCPGGDLKKLISRCRQTSTYLEEGFIWKVLKQIASALHVCHGKTVNNGKIVLHRDIKPANVFLDNDGNVKLGDFGLARTLSCGTSFARSIVGTPYYMSPEVINGNVYNEKSDIWSLGCLIYELCSLHPPFMASTAKELAVKISKAKYDRIPVHYSDDLWKMIELLLTLEDFLRPTALMIRHHSAVVDNNSTKSFSSESSAEDPFSISISPNPPENQFNSKQNLASSQAISNDDENHVVPCSDNLVEENDEFCHEDHQVDSEVSKIMSDYIEYEQEQVPSQNYINRFDSEFNENNYLNSYHCLSPVEEVKEEEEIVFNKTQNVHETHFDFIPEDDVQISTVHHIEMGKTTNINTDNYVEREKTTEIDMPIEKLEQEIHNSTVFTDKSFVCMCKSMTFDEWKVRISALRRAESAVKQKMMVIEERERELNVREKRVGAMEREARNHLIRAQIFLKHTRLKGQVSNNPHRSISDLDTTVSADIGEDQIITTAQLDPYLLNNPFLELRENKHITFDDVNKVNADFTKKSHTLDNPKSRRKRGDIFTLVRDWEYNENRLNILSKPAEKDDSPVDDQLGDGKEEKNLVTASIKEDVKTVEKQPKAKTFLRALHRNCKKVTQTKTSHEPKSKNLKDTTGKETANKSKTNPKHNTKTNISQVSQTKKTIGKTVKVVETKKTKGNTKEKTAQAGDKENIESNSKNKTTSNKIKSAIIKESSIKPSTKPPRDWQIKTRQTKKVLSDKNKNETKSSNDVVSKRITRSQVKNVHYF